MAGVATDLMLHRGASLLLMRGGGGPSPLPTHFKHTPSTHTFTLKCSLKQEQRCVIRCVRPPSTTRIIQAGEDEGRTDLLYASVTPTPTLLLFTGCCQNTPEDQAWWCLCSQGRRRQAERGNVVLEEMRYRQPTGFWLSVWSLSGTLCQTSAEKSVEVKSFSLKTAGEAESQTSFCVSAVPQHAVRSSELHHGEGGEHPAVQPLAPTHPHLTPTAPDRTQKQTQDQELTSIQTEPVELKPRTLSRTGLTHLCAKNTEFKPTRGGRRTGGGGHETKTQNEGIQNWFLTLFDMFAFLGFQSFKAVFVVQKRGDQFAIIKKVRRQKNTIKDFLCIAAIQLLPTVLIQPTENEKEEEWSTSWSCGAFKAAVGC